MAIIKATMFFEAGRYGWSESWYKEGSIGAIASEMSGLAAKRKAFLASYATQTVIRVSDESIKGDSLIVSGGGPGDIAYSSYNDILTTNDWEIPPTCIQYRFNASTLVRATRPFRGLPEVTRGDVEAFMASAFLMNVRNLADLFFNALIAGNFGIKNAENAAAPQGVFLVSGSSLGTVMQYDNPHGYAIGDQLVMRGFSGSGVLKGRTRVLAVPTTDTAVIDKPHLSTYLYRGGATTAKLEFAVSPITGFTFSGVRMRKTGRPFGLPVGRSTAIY